MSMGDRTAIEDDVLAFFLESSGALPTDVLLAAKSEKARQPGSRLADMVRGHVSDPELEALVDRARSSVHPCPDCGKELVIELTPGRKSPNRCRACHERVCKAETVLPYQDARPPRSVSVRVNHESTIDVVPTAVETFSVGETIDGYTIERKLGQGAMGVVLLAKDRAGKRVAIKVLLGEQTGTLLARFQREARSIARLDHPGIVKLLDMGTFGAHPYIVMEAVPGVSLKTYAESGLAVDAALAIVEQIGRAIDHAHRHGVIHRDLKPANVLVTRDRQVKVVDFGLAKDLDSGTVITDSRTAVGTPWYMSPEQIHGAKADPPVGPSTDIYSLGTILYQLLVGQVPFDGDDTADLFRAILFGTPIPPSAMKPGLPRDVDRLVLRALEKAPADRYATAAELADDVARLRRGEPLKGALAPSAALGPGGNLGGYAILYELGRGCLGRVWRCRTRSGSVVAVKAFRRSVGGDRDFFATVSELRELGEKEGFVPILDASTTTDGLLVAMKLLGKSLRERLGRPLPIDEVLIIGQNVARALGVAHARSIVHGDLKPENVLFAEGGRPLLADTAVARHFATEMTGGVQCVVLPGEKPVTAGYMAPEQLADPAATSPQADIFSLGAILHECLTGKPAFSGKSLLPMVTAVATCSPEPIERARPDAPPWLAQVVRQCLAREPEKRFASGVELAQGLAQPDTESGILRGLGKRFGL